MFYTIYKITNQINGKFYIGSHKTNDLDDSYMGSGKYLIKAQEKHGIENFTKEILFVFDNPHDMYAKEAEIVNEDFISEQNTYNVKIGGFGGWDYINKTGKNLYGMNGKTPNVKDNFERGRKTQIEKKKADPNYAKQISEKISKTQKEQYRNGRTPSFKGKTHTAETKALIGSKNSTHQAGSKNSQFGTCWIWCKSLGNKKIKKEQLSEYLNQGWEKTYKPGYRV